MTPASLRTLMARAFAEEVEKYAWNDTCVMDQSTDGHDVVYRGHSRSADGGGAMSEAICIAHWRSDDFGRHKGKAVVLDLMPSGEYWLNKFPGQKIQKFVDRSKAMRAFELAVKQ